MGSTKSHERKTEGEGHPPPTRPAPTPEPGPERPATKSHERK